KEKYKIRCTDTNYLELINQLIENYIVAEISFHEVRTIAIGEQKAGKDLGPEDLPNAPSIEFKAPEDLHYVVFAHKAKQAFKLHNDYYKTIPSSRARQL